MTSGANDHVSRRTALKATGGVVGGLAVAGSGLPAAVATQADYYRYDGVLARLVNVDAQPPSFRTVRTALFLTEARLSDCNTGHPCSIDVLEYEPLDDDDDDNGDDDNGDGDDDDDNDNDGDDNENDNDDDDNGDDNNGDDNDDNDDDCPGFASVVLLCHGETPSDAVVLTGLMPHVLDRFPEFDYDFVVGLSPSNETNVTDPASVANPCPNNDDDDNNDDDGDDDDDGNDDNDGDDDNGDNGDDDDNGDDNDDDDDNDDNGDDDNDD